MLKRTVVIFTAAAFFGVAVPTQTARADDMWDMMDPSWWYDEIFDDDDDKWWRYRHNRYSPYWGGPHWGSPYGWQAPPYVIHIKSGTNEQNPDSRRPE